MWELLSPKTIHPNYCHIISYQIFIPLPTKHIPQKGDCKPVSHLLPSPQGNPQTMNSSLSFSDIHSSQIAISIAERYAFPGVDYFETAQCHMAQNHFLRDLSFSIEDISKASAQLFMPYSVGLIVDYLTRSHQYYLNKSLPEIGNTLDAAIRNCPEDGWFRRFAMPLFRKYVNDTVDHFAYEESHLFPYALQLEKAYRTSMPLPPDVQYTSAEFMASHPHSEIDLPKVLAILSSKEDDFKDDIAYRILLKRLRHLEQDMRLHSLIEDDVLVFKLQMLENR